MNKHDEKFQQIHQSLLQIKSITNRIKFITNRINNRLTAMERRINKQNCIRSIDCQCADCAENFLQEECLRSVDCQCADCIEGSCTLEDLDSSIKGCENVEFIVGMSPLDPVVIEALEELFLDEHFMETEGMNNTYKVFDKMTERNVVGYANFGFETLQDMYVDEIFMEPIDPKSNFIVPDPVRGSNMLLELDAMNISSFMTDSSIHFASKKQIDISKIIFDPGGTTVDVLRSGYMQFVEYHFSSLLNVSSISWLLNCDRRIIFNWLSHSRELLKRFEIKANVSSLVKYCLDHVMSYIATCSTRMKECIWEQFLVWNAYWRNIMFGDMELLDPLVEFSMTFEREGCVSLFQRVPDSEVLSQNCRLPFHFIVENDGLRFVSEYIRLMTNGSLVQVFIHTAVRNGYKLVDANFVFKKGKFSVVLFDWVPAVHCFPLIQWEELKLVVISILWVAGQNVKTIVKAGVTRLLELLNVSLICPVKHALLTDFPWAANCWNKAGLQNDATITKFDPGGISWEANAFKGASDLYLECGDCYNYEFFSFEVLQRSLNGCSTIAHDSLDRNISIWGSICLKNHVKMTIMLVVWCSEQSGCTSVGKLILLHYCYWHWHFCGCSILSVLNL